MKTAVRELNVAARLRSKAELHPDKPAVIAAKGRRQYEQLTFAQLEGRSEVYAAGLKALGIVRGTRTVLMVRPGLEFFSLTFALFKIGAVIVMVDPGMGMKRLKRCLAEAEPQAFIGIPVAHAARRLLGWARSTNRINVTVGRRWFWGGATTERLRRIGAPSESMAVADADEVAAILFTSGSTGDPKGAVYTHGIFSAQVDYLREQFQFTGEEVDLATFPLFALFDPALGITAVIPEMDASRPARAEPARLIEAIEDCKVTQMFGSPALIENLARHGEAQGVKLARLNRVMTAGAPVRPAILESLRKMLPDEAEVFTPYGATEALPVSSIESREILGETRAETERGGGNCVGRPIAHLEVRIIRIADEPIERWSEDLVLGAGEVGEIVVQGPVVTCEYYGRPEATRGAKIASAEGGAIYHRMGDVGRFDPQGRLWFYGRKNHRVVTSKTTLFTIPCEAIFNTHPRVHRSALVGVGKMGAQTPAVLVELEGGARKRTGTEQLFAELRSLAESHEHTRFIRRFFVHPNFPVDARHNAKIIREQLAEWAAERMHE